MFGTVKAGCIAGESLGLEDGVHGSVGVGTDLGMTTVSVVGQRVDQTGHLTLSQRGWVQVWPHVLCVALLKFSL